MKYRIPNILEGLQRSAANLALALGLVVGMSVPMALSAQIGVGTTNPHPSSMLHISAGAGNNKGFLVPKVTSAQRIVLDSTQNIANGLMFFDSDLQKFYYFGQSPRTWKEIDSDWIRKDVAGASPVIGTHIYSGVSGNVGIGTASNVNPASKLTVVGTMSVGTAAYTQDSVAPANGVTIGTWLGIGTRTRTTGSVFDVKGASHFRNGDVTVDQDVYANNFHGMGVVPQFGIIMFSGAITGNFQASGAGVVGTQYEGWALCDGRNGTPDLRGRFIVGKTNTDGTTYGYANAERNYAGFLNIGGNGGDDSTTLTINEMPAHAHTGNTGSAGSHQHVSFRNGTTDAAGTGQVADSDIADGTSGNNVESGTNGDGTIECRTESAGSHSHTISTQGLGKSFNNRPPYYVLAYIMKQ